MERSRDLQALLREAPTPLSVKDYTKDEAEVYTTFGDAYVSWQLQRRTMWFLLPAYPGSLLMVGAFYYLKGKGVINLNTQELWQLVGLVGLVNSLMTWVVRTLFKGPTGQRAKSSGSRKQ
jgi:hypothetical protein